MRGHYKNTSNEDFFQMIVADDIAEEYHDTVGFFFKFFMINIPKSNMPLKLI